MLAGYYEVRVRDCYEVRVRDCYIVFIIIIIIILLKIIDDDAYRVDTLSVIVAITNLNLI